MTCAKATVTCRLLVDGDVVLATNACANPQAVCPRAPGEDYTKCTTICGQQGHAEVQAVAKARRLGYDLTGAHAIIAGHTYACMDCQHALYGAGVKTIEVRR